LKIEGLPPIICGITPKISGIMTENKVKCDHKGENPCPSLKKGEMEKKLIWTQEEELYVLVAASNTYIISSLSSVSSSGSGYRRNRNQNRRSRNRFTLMLSSTMMSAMAAFLVIFMVASPLSITVNAEFIKYNKHALLPGKPEYMSFPKYSKRDVPNWQPGHGRSFIDLSRLTFTADCSVTMEGCEDTTLELLMFEESTDFPWIDYWEDRTICCSVSIYACTEFLTL
jgi:hypothetical protein